MQHDDDADYANTSSSSKRGRKRKEAEKSNKEKESSSSGIKQKFFICFIIYISLYIHLFSNYIHIGMPSVEDVCSAFNVTDVDIEYSETDLQTLTTYKAFTQHVRPILQKENTKVPAPKLMMLVAAKWREFCDSNPNLQTEQSRSDEADEPRSSRSSRNEKVWGNDRFIHLHTYF